MELDRPKSSYGVFVVLLSLIFSLFIYLFTIKPLAQSYKNLSVQETQKEAELKRYTDKRTVLERAKENEDVLKEMQDSILKIVPFKDDRPDTYWQFEKLSEISKIATRSVSQARFIEDSKLYSAFSEQAFSLSSSGSYGAMLDFLKSVEGSMRLFNIDSITLAPNGNNVNLGLNVNTYYGKEVQIED